MATKRKQKYPNTEYFNYYNANPKGRLTGDCVARAITKACVRDYNEVVMEMARFHCETGYHPTSEVARYMEWLGYEKQPQPRHPDGTKYTLKEFIKKHKTGRYVVNLPGHNTAVINGKCYDTWDCSLYSRRVGNYWKIK